MAALIIQTNPDGSVSIAAPTQIPPELMADAEQVESIEQAAQVLQDVLGAEQAGGTVPDESVDPAGSGDGTPVKQQPAQDPEADMEQGFRNVRGAPR